MLFDVGTVEGIHKLIDGIVKRIDELIEGTVERIHVVVVERINEFSLPQPPSLPLRCDNLSRA